MIAMGGLSISPDAMRQQIASAIGLIVQVMRLSDGKRKVTHVTEITGMEGQVVQMQDIFTFNRTGTDPDGTVHGEFRATGLRPRILDEMNRRGIVYDVANFDPSRALLMS
jgi:pilus assembly protein CpaF